MDLPLSVEIQFLVILTTSPGCTEALLWQPAHVVEDILCTKFCSGTMVCWINLRSSGDSSSSDEDGPAPSALSSSMGTGPVSSREPAIISFCTAGTRGTDDSHGLFRRWSATWEEKNCLEERKNERNKVLGKKWSTTWGRHDKVERNNRRRENEDKT